MNTQKYVWDGYFFYEVLSRAGGWVTIRTAEHTLRIPETDCVPVGATGFPLASWRE